MPWRPLPSSPDGLPPKLGNLAVAARAGISVPPTVWLPAADTAGAAAPPALSSAPLILRSASPTEDREGGSQAGRFHSEVVEVPEDGASFARSLAAVVASLPRDPGGRVLGCVFAQPFRRPERAGVAFFDGFYFERTSAAGGNAALTSGRERGDVERGHVERDDPWTDWLLAVYRAFGGRGAVDVEYAVDGGRHELLQCRPAAFEVRRNPTLSLANHREILGEAPSPWIVSAVVEAGRDATRFFSEADPRIERWREPYAVELLGRAWMSFAFFFRVMDHWGLPRAWVTEGVGGVSRGPADARFDLRRVLRSVVPLVRLQWRSLRAVLRAERELLRLREAIAGAADLRGLFEANVLGMDVALRTNFGLGGMLSGAARVRAALGIRGRPRVVTAEMMRGYDALRGVPDAEREAALGKWLARHGHRGPLESDPRQPRFAEMRDALLADLARPARGGGGARTPGSDAPWFWLERRREWFRDELMRAWAELRRRLLAEGARLVAEGALDAVDDVFHLRGEDVRAGDVDLRERAAANRRAAERAHALRVPLTASRDELLERADGGAPPRAPSGDGELRGIGLGGAVVRGRVRRARTVEEALRDGDLDGRTVLVTTALEPSWALVFGRVGAVVVEIGGELSHASILLREAGTPAVVNCAGAWDGLRDGDEVLVDPERGRVRRVGGAPAREASPVAGRSPAA